MEDTFLLVVNPRAGAGLAGRQLPNLRRELELAGAQFAVARTKRPRHAESIVREALQNELKGIAVVGGDGTFNEATNGFFDHDGQLINRDAWLGLLPCGTGGDFRKSVGLEQDISSSVQHLMQSSAQAIDIGWMTYLDFNGHEQQRAFLNIASFGIAGLVCQIVNDTPKWLGGRVSFFAGTLRAIRRYKPSRVRLQVDDQDPIEISVLNTAVANGQFFGGGMHIAPQGSLSDGLFDVISLTGEKASELLRLTSKIYSGSHLGSEGVNASQGTRITATPLGSDPVTVEMDGEPVGVLPATFELRKRAIKLRAPKIG